MRGTALHSIEARITPDGLLEFPASFLQERGVVRLLEPADADLHHLVRLLRDGEYPRPFVIDDGKLRRLHFTLALVQSEMDVAEPFALHAAYTRKMMAFLLFLPRPKHVVIVGLGGGSLTKFCHRHLARSRITTVEISEDVIALREQFALPPDDERLAIVCEDAVEYFASTDDRADVVLLDGYDENGIVPAFCDERFYLAIRARLKPAGMLVCNLAVKGDESAAHIELLRDVFRDRLIVQEVAGDGNRIAFAFNDEGYPPDWPAVEREARALAQRLALDFTGFAQKLAKSAQRERRRR
ncbi:spermidine synthase-like protein [Niveibacterium microcysteis]|uniref:Spermidine synthase-like protein n=1 Tax=Niveibacterium microcysteis TaxID=2811415 RepID=A0ABX7M615_9RHOO|nr:spermidine synthase-like protein [Niveibacterium microcysteis]QSI76874.1 spermidine synthase-like protein [Niveibacterium microcysteis]